MIIFHDWELETSGEVIARQFDNLTRTLAVTGDVPTGWEWAMLVQVDKAMDIIPLTQAEGALSAVLSAQQLSVSGSYTMQLRAIQGDRVKHTNTINVYIPASLSGDEQWPTVPSEFSDMEHRIMEKASEAEGYATHPPTIGENGNWWEWDGTVYADTGILADVTNMEKALEDINEALSRIANLQESYMSIEQLDAITAEQETLIGGGAE